MSHSVRQHCKRALSGLSTAIDDAASPDRLILWLPVGFGCGIAVYFALPAEPPPWTGLAVVFAALALAALLRRSFSGLLIGAALLAGSLGFGVAQLQTQGNYTRFIDRERGPVGVSGQVMSAEPALSGARLLIDRARISGLEAFATPARIRVVSRGDASNAIRPGDWVRVRAQLSPPSPPVLPGGFDFQRHAFFQGIGASGFALGAPELIAPSAATRLSIDGAKIAIETLRTAAARRVLAILPGEEGAIAAALLTGHRYAIAKAPKAAMRDSGLAHLLAISGLHVGLVTGLIFFLSRAAFALVPGWALHRPIKKWAAATALLGALAYTLLAGASVPTQRAFIMAAFVLGAIMIDRRGITMRLVAWAAIAVMLWRPDALMGPGFQMSFAAVVALVATYNVAGPWFRVTFGGNAPWPRRFAGYLTGVALSTLIAGFATAPFAVYHFQQTALYGLLANLLAVPMTGLWILPAGLLAMVAMPFDAERLPLHVMGHGISIVLEIARAVAGLPNAVAHVPALPSGFIVTATLGGLWLCLHRGRIRLLGLVPLTAALAWPASVTPPDLFVAEQGGVVAWRAADELRFLDRRPRAHRFERDLLHRVSGAPERGSAIDALPCDELGCRLTIGGRRLAIVWHEGALIEDCWDTDLLIAIVPVRQRCPGPATVIDRFDLRRLGGLTVQATGGTLVVTTVAEQRKPRPWAQTGPGVEAAGYRSGQY